MATWTKVLWISSVVLGTLLAVLGLAFLFGIFPSIMRKKIEENLVLRNGTDQAKRFEDSPVPSHLSFYIFNVTNKEEVNSNGSKADLQELGPYVFREEKIKEVSSWDEDTGTVKYLERSIFHFDSENSNGNLSDVINHVNIITIVLREKLIEIGLFSFIKMLKGDFIETHSADELLFSGFNIQNYLPPIIPTFLCKKWIPDCKFGFYYGKNESLSKMYEVSTGVLGMDDYTKVLRYDNKRQLPFWYAPSCNAINGTDGRQFPPGTDKDKDLYLFNPDICRSVMIKFEEDVTVEEIPALRFTAPESVFADPNIDKDNMCFCQNDTSEACPTKAGLAPMAPCESGAPLLVSAPHFYQGDEEYWKAFNGLLPVKDKHESLIDIEPLTGQVIRAAKRLQINVEADPDSRLPCLAHLTNTTYFPVYWEEEGGVIDAKSASDFRKKVLVPYNATRYSLIALSSLGVAIILVLAVIFIVKRVKSKEVPYDSVPREETES